MILTKVKCLKNLNLKNYGECVKNNIYIFRIISNNILLLTNKNVWYNLSNINKYLDKQVLFIQNNFEKITDIEIDKCELGYVSFLICKSNLKNRLSLNREDSIKPLKCSSFNFGDFFYHDILLNNENLDNIKEFIVTYNIGIANNNYFNKSLFEFMEKIFSNKLKYEYLISRILEKIEYDDTCFDDIENLLKFEKDNDDEFKYIVLIGILIEITNMYQKMNNNKNFIIILCENNSYHYEIFKLNKHKPEIRKIIN